MRDTSSSQMRGGGDVVLGDDWVAPDSTVEKELRAKRARRSFLSLRGSPLTRKIITFNLIALNILVAGILYLNATRESLVLQRAGARQVIGFGRAKVMSPSTRGPRKGGAGTHLERHRT